jgi:ABC-type transport system involved in multi-copper enzyme maturation permease subunit
MHEEMPVRTYDTAQLQVQQPETEAKDRVRWSAVFAGLLTALSTLALLSLLGLAIGASAYNPGDNAGNYGLGAGLWGGLSALLAFLVGGWVAARTAGVRGERNGMLNGAMVWALAIPLLLYLLSSGIGAAARTASTVASGGLEAAAQTTDNNPNLTGAQTPAEAGVNNLQDQANALTTPENVNNIADATRRGALGTLGSLLLGLGAASLGGYFGSRPLHEWRMNRRIVT